MLRPLLLLSVLAAGLAVPSPAAAQEASPRPGCGAPPSISTVVEPARVQPGATATVTVTVRDEPCYADESRAHEVSLFVQRAGTRDPAPLASGTTDRSGRFTYAETVDRTSTYYAGVRDDVRRGGTTSATVQVGCPVLTLAGDPEEAGNTATVVNQPLTLEARAEDPGAAYRLEVTSPYVGPVRSGSGARTLFRVRPAENTVVRLRSTLSGQYACVSNSLRLVVEPVLTIDARRVGPREYVFTGRVLPGRQQLVTLYRHDGASRTIAAQRRADPDGTYFLGRVFSTAGRYGFSVGVSSSATNLAGSSRIRPTLVH